MNVQRAHSSEESPRSTGRLIGWLVTYSQEENGKAIELRAGRYVVSSEQNSRDPNQITIGGRDISAPHAALRATDKHSLLILDVFSESGTFLRKAGSETDSPVQGVVSINHGDWVRFGNGTKFQVCLIDGPRR